MKAITVRQPWAWAIMHGGKDVENRSRNIVGDYRGRVAIHAGLTMAPEAIEAVAERVGCSVSSLIGTLAEQPRGFVIGTVNLRAAHSPAPDAFSITDSLWAMDGYWHLCLSDPRPFPEPIPAKGRLGLWNFEEIA